MLYLLKLFVFHLSISAVVWCQLAWYTKFSGLSRTWVQILPLFISSFVSFKLKGLQFHEHFQLEIPSKCDVKAENSSTLCKFHEGRKGATPMGSNADR